MTESTLARGAPGNQRIARAWEMVGGMRGVLIGALPIVLEVISPNRVWFSVAVTVFYLVAALILVRPRSIDAIGRPTLVFAVVAIAFMGLSILRMETIDPLNAAQRSYGLGKASYFIEVAIPLGAAVALLVSKLDDLKPAVVVFLVLGIGLAIPTVLLQNQSLLGPTRYTVQGNLIVIAGLLVCQFWIIRDIRFVAGLGLLCLLGVVTTQSRQSVAAYIVGLAITGVYWFAADRVRAASGKPSALTQMWLLPALGYGVVLVAALIWTALILQPGWLPVPHWVKDPVTCNCIAGRFVDLIAHPGGRNILIEQSWALFASHPIFGAGLGAFVGLADYNYPHNLPLELGSEMGLVGILILLVPLLVGWVRLALAGIKAASPAVASLIVLVVVYVVVANLSGDLASQRGLWVFGLVALKLGWRDNPAEIGNA